jgi:hypothetical protein
MAINFPSALDSLTNPSASEKLNSPSHAGQHGDVNDAVEALETKVGINSSADTSSLDYKVTTAESDIDTLQSDVSTLQASVTVIGATVDELDDSRPLGAFVGTEANAQYVCDGTSDEIQINEALLSLTAGRTWQEKVVLKGNFVIDDSIEIPSYTILEIQGKIKAADSCSILATRGLVQNLGREMGTNNATRITILGGELDGNKDNNTGGDQEGISILNTTDFLIDGVYIHDCDECGTVTYGRTDKTFTETPITLYEGASWGRVQNCTYVDNTSGGIQLNGNWNSTLVINCDSYENDSSGIDIKNDYNVDQTVEPNGHTVMNCNFFNNSGSGINVAKSGDYDISNVSLIGNRCYGNAGRGMNINQADSIQVVGNVCWQNDHDGIKLNDVTNFICNSNWCYNNDQAAGSGSGNTRSGISVGFPTGTVNASICNNICGDDQDTPTQYRGIRLLAGAGVSPANVLVQGNICNNNTTNNLYYYVPGGAGTDFIVRNNIGFVTENSGTATVSNGDTTVVVTHGLSVTPVAGNVIVVPGSDMGSATDFFVGTYTSTQFTITVNTNPGKDVAFVWQARVTSMA